MIHGRQPISAQNIKKTQLSFITCSHLVGLIVQTGQIVSKLFLCTYVFGFVLH